MNKEKYNQIIDEVYKKYADSHKYFVNGWLHVIPMAHNKETFINECKTDPEFSEKWGLKIEKRELSYKERLSCLQNILDKTDTKLSITNETTYEQLWDYYNIPTKLITVTYNDIKTEIYE
jgi:hypothetical protein